jgi:hypothetical protein
LVPSWFPLGSLLITWVGVDDGMGFLGWVITSFSRVQKRCSVMGDLRSSSIDVKSVVPGTVDDDCTDDDGVQEVGTGKKDDDANGDEDDEVKNEVMDDSDDSDEEEEEEVDEYIKNDDLLVRNNAIISKSEAKLAVIKKTEIALKKVIRKHRISNTSRLKVIANEANDFNEQIKTNIKLVCSLKNAWKSYWSVSRAWLAEVATWTGATTGAAIVPLVPDPDGVMSKGKGKGKTKGTSSGGVAPTPAKESESELKSSITTTTSTTTTTTTTTSTITTTSDTANTITDATDAKLTITPSGIITTASSGGAAPALRMWLGWTKLHSRVVACSKQLCAIELSSAFLPFADAKAMKSAFRLSMKNIDDLLSVKAKVRKAHPSYTKMLKHWYLRYRNVGVEDLAIAAQAISMADQRILETYCKELVKLGQGTMRRLVQPTCWYPLSYTPPMLRRVNEKHLEAFRRKRNLHRASVKRVRIAGATGATGATPPDDVMIKGKGKAKAKTKTKTKGNGNGNGKTKTKTTSSGLETYVAPETNVTSKDDDEDDDDVMIITDTSDTWSKSSTSKDITLKGKGASSG